MDCDQALTLVHPYVDGEIDIVTVLEVERHLAGCPACAAQEAGVRELRATIREAVPYRDAPLRLEKRVRTAIRDARRAESRQSFAFPRWAWGGAAVAILLAAIVFRGMLPFGAASPDSTARELIDDHLRSLTANHLTDVVSSNQHTVKPWFDGRINFTPKVEDLTADGFPLIGGRIDYLESRPVAAIVYRCRQHVINLFVWPAPGAADAPASSETVAGYNIVHWTNSGMAYWAVSSLGNAELGRFARLLSQESPANPAPHG
jgi:anti-sigma factor RsiW